MAEKSAHGISLPLFALLQRLAPKPVGEVLADLAKGLEALELSEHLDPVLMEDDIAINPKTEFGRQVLEELKVRSEFYPCPEGQCECGKESACQWCGKDKR